MGDYSEFSLATRAFLHAYRWRRIDPVPWSPLRKPLAQARVAIVSTAGFVVRGRTPFDRNLKGGDWSYREVPSATPTSDLVDSHRSQSFDHAGIDTDPNVGFPIDRIRELADEGVIGSVNDRHFSFMGSITAPGRLMSESAPKAARLLVADGVDAVLLVPV